jgi:tetratricopeptide (TPR) repeat protein
MSIKILFCLFLFLVSQYSYGQASAEELAKAQEKLAEVQKLYSKEHIEYAKAALDLALLYYQDEDIFAQEEAYELAYEALFIARKEDRLTGSLYSDFLSKLPTPQVLLIDANVDLDATEESEGAESPLYAKKLIKLSKVAANDEYEYSSSYEYAIKAYQILAKLPLEVTRLIYEYANQNLSSEVIEVLEQEIRLKRARTSNDSLELADALVSYSNLGTLYKKNKLLYIFMDESYDRFKQALDIYEKELGKEHPKYKKAYSALTKEMQDFYPIEKSILDRIKKHETANDLFIADFRRYLKIVDTTLILTYTVKVAFNWVLEDLKKYHGGTDGRYYTIVKDIRSTWGADEDEQNFVIQKGITERTLTEFGISEKYVAELIKKTNLSIHILGEKRIPHYKRAFEILDSIELEPPFNTREETLFQKYVKEVIPPYKLFLIKDHNLSIKRAIYGINSNEYISTSFETAWHYLRDDDLWELGKDLLLTGLPQINDNNRYLAEKWIDSLFSNDVALVIDIARLELIKAFPLSNLKRLLKKPLKAIEQKEGINSFEYHYVLEFLADAYFFSKNNPVHAREAINLYKKLLLAYSNLKGKSIDYENLLHRIVDNMAIYTPWSETESLFFFEELIRLTKQNKDKSYPYNVKKYADWHYNNERIISAESYYKLFIELYQKEAKKEKKKLLYIESCYNLARIYRKTGRPGKAFSLYSKTLALSRTTNQLIYIIKCLDDLGLIAHQKEDSKYALELFQEALDALKVAEEANLALEDRHNNFKMALLYVKIKRHIARVHLEDGYIEIAERYYDEIKKFERDKNTPVSFRKDISLQYDLAYLAEIKGDSAKATGYYQAAIRNIKDKDELAKANLAFANFYQQQEKDSLAAIYLKDALAIDLNRIEKNYTNLAEKERLLFLSPISERLNVFFNFALPKEDSALTLTAFNAHLTVKGLALETSTNLQSVCNQTENTVLKNKCFKMQALRKLLAKSTSLPLEEQEKISAQIVDLEKEIGVSSRDLRAHFGKDNKKLNFYQLKQILKAVETEDSLALAIDFLVVDQVDEYGYQVSVYYAAVIGANYKSPIFVRLATQEELEDVLASDIAPNTINYITDDFESRYLYELVWEPLLPYLLDAKRLHICPTGILSKIAFGTLRTGDYDRRRIMDEWSVHYYSSLRDLLNPQVGKLGQGVTNVGLVGGVKFTFTEKEIQNLARQNDIPDLEVKEALKEQTVQKERFSSSRGARGEDFSYLPGTLEEVNAISTIFPEGWVINLLSDTLATEENLEIMTDNSPTILHIATHGYFFPSPPKEDNDDIWLNSKKSVTLEDKISNLANPLLRSGLALAGINRVWKGGAEIEGLDDGILTALEVANMDLFNTNLVVLSACETGRGDIDNNEGIMGLRRAFKTAGAKQLLISLWKVPDEQTSELMQLFYKGYIKGLSAHQAFQEAQYTMRKRYKNPYYWAAFLLIE